MTARSRTLIVLRHAKSAWPPDTPDLERPLAPRGRRDAPAVGHWLYAAGHRPDLVLCSPARRARETWELAAAELDAPPPVRHDPRLHHSGVPGLLDALHEVADDIGTLLLVGHNPELEELVVALAGDAVGDTRQQAETAFPTSAVAVLTWDGDWTDLRPGAALLTEVAVPRGWKP